MGERVRRDYTVRMIRLGLIALLAVPALAAPRDEWPEAARNAAQETTRKYGPPAEAGEDALVWYGNGPWKKTAVYRRAWPRSAVAGDKGFLENTVEFRVPDGKVSELARFDNRLDADPLAGELSARSESEELNFLLLNLAYDIVSGKRSLKEARDFYAKNARPAEGAKPSAYLGGLLFGGDAARKPCGCRLDS